MDAKKIVGLIFSIIFVGAFAFVLTWGITNFNKVQEGISGTELYNQEDINKAYQDGYDNALSNKTEYDELINGYRDTITNQTDQISQLNSQITSLNNANRDYSTQITNLESQKANLEQQVATLTTVKTNNESMISELNSQIKILNNEINDLKNEGTNKDNEIVQKNIQIQNLQSTISQLQKTNELNIQTISNLNNQISSLNSQITDMTLQIQNNSSSVSSLNAKIVELEKSVAYYEQYIASLESGEQFVVTFEFNGSVYNIQVVNKNDIVTVTEPTSTEYITFNYWTVNGERVDMTTYQVTSNVKFVANITQKYDVIFMVDNEVYNKQVVVKNGIAILPENPSKDGYEFDGWTTNGVDILTPETSLVTQKITYIAKFTKLYNVTFLYESETLSSQIVRNGGYAENVEASSSTYKVFNGWSYNGVIVDISSQKIVADTTFIANITYKYDVNFVVDENIYNSQIIQKNSFATIPANPSKNGYVFEGWTLNGIDIITVYNYVITENTTFIAKFSVAEGLFSDDGTLVMSWDDMIANDYISVNEAGVVSQGTSPTRTTMSGKLLIAEGVTAFENGSNGALGVFSDCTNLTSITLPTTLTSLGKNTFYNCTGLNEIVVNSSNLSGLGSSYYTFYNAGQSGSGISVIFTDSVEKIPSYLFLEGFTTDNSPKVTSVSIGKNVKQIGSYAFAYAKYLENINIPGSVTTIGSSGFLRCENLKSIILNEGIETLGANMFDGCSSLTSLVIPNSLTSIGTYSFNCTSLLAITVRENNTMYSSIDGILYSKDQTTLITYPAGRTAETFTIPSFVTSLESSAFRHSQFLEEMTIPETVTNIGSYLFSGALSLRTVKIETNVTAIPSYMFMGCVNLTSVRMPSTITKINLCAFQSSGIKNLTIPSAVTSLGNKCFYECKSLQSITLSSSLTTIGSSCFEYCSALTSITIPDSVTSIEYYSFRHCTNLKSVSIGSGLTKLNSYLFGYCESLTSVTFKSGLTEMASSVFFGCTSLTSITLPSTLQIIGMGVFEDCTSLKTIIIPSSVTTIDSGVFENCTALRGIYIPSTVSDIDCYSYSYSIVKGCSSSLVIYTDASKASYYWGDFNYIAKDTTITVKYNQSLSSFKSAMGI